MNATLSLLGEILKIVLPAGIAVYGMYMLVRNFTNKEFSTRLAQLKAQHSDQTLPLRLGAYERLAIYLERITPNNLILRLNDQSYNALQLQHQLIHSVREEFNHNLSQQVYVSDEAWNMVVNAKEEVVSLINRAAQGMGEDTPSLHLAKKIFEQVIEEGDRTSPALYYLKQEIRELF